MNRKMHKGAEDLIKSGRYDNSDSFSVVIQPIMKQAKPPLNVNIMLNNFF